MVVFRGCVRAAVLSSGVVAFAVSEVMVVIEVRSCRR